MLKNNASILLIKNQINCLKEHDYKYFDSQVIIALFNLQYDYTEESKIYLKNILKKSSENIYIAFIFADCLIKQGSYE